MGYFVTNKDTLYIKFDLNTQTIVQNDSVFIKYHISELETGGFDFDFTNSNFKLFSHTLSNIYKVIKKSGTITNDVGIFNETIEFISDLNSTIKKTITLQVEYFNSENPETPLPEPEPTYNLKYWLEFTNQNQWL